MSKGKHPNYVPIWDNNVIWSLLEYVLTTSKIKQCIVLKKIHSIV